MANQLKEAVVNAVYVLLERGWSQRRIARTAGIDRGTVARYARRAQEPANPAGTPPGSAAIRAFVRGDESQAKAAKAPPGSGPEKTSPYDVAAEADPASEVPPGPSGADNASASTSQSQREAFREVIPAKLELGLTAKRGELVEHLPTRLIRTQEGGVCFDPDTSVKARIG